MVNTGKFLGANTLDSAIGQPVVVVYLISNDMNSAGFLCEQNATWPVVRK